MQESTLKLLGLLSNVIIISLIFAAPIILLIILMYFYDRYKKFKDKEQREAERIIIKNNEGIRATASNIKTLDEQFKKLDYDVLKLREEKRQLEIELGHTSEDEPEVINEGTNYDEMTIKELHDIARELKIKGFSRMKKDKLVDILETNEQARQ